MIQWLVDPVNQDVLGAETAFNKFHAECPLPTLPIKVSRHTQIPKFPVCRVLSTFIEKLGHEERLYIGSGIQTPTGVRARLKEYENGKLLPKLFKHYLAQGYKIKTNEKSKTRPK